MTAAADGRRRCLVGLSLVPGLGPVRLDSLIRHLGSPEAVWHARPDVLAETPGVGRGLAAAIAAAREPAMVDREFEKAARAGARLLTWLDHDYPARLRAIPAPPPVLYVRGAWPEHAAAVAIVGTRRASPYGLSVAERLAAGVAEQGVIVVSGLARGIDAAAHRAALQAGGLTLGVLACGVDVVYPPEHRFLMEAMCAAGALVAEAPMGSPPERGAFPARNRLISGLADATVVVEGGVTSGALITARRADAQGRPVFAVPGSVYGAGSRGPHHLLARGARIVTSPDDLLAALRDASREEGAAEDNVPARGRRRAHPAGSATAHLPPIERRLLDALPDGEARPVDDLAAAAQIEVPAAAAALVALELRGVLRRMPGGFYARNPLWRGGQI